jgi:hypothetical protein
MAVLRRDPAAETPVLRDLDLDRREMDRLHLDRREMDHLAEGRRAVALRTDPDLVHPEMDHLGAAEREADHQDRVRELDRGPVRPNPGDRVGGRTGVGRQAAGHTEEAGRREMDHLGERPIQGEQPEPDPAADPSPEDHRELDHLGADRLELDHLEMDRLGEDHRDQPLAEELPAAPRRTSRTCSRADWRCRIGGNGPSRPPERARHPAFSSGKWPAA